MLIYVTPLPHAGLTIIKTFEKIAKDLSEAEGSDRRWEIGKLPATKDYVVSASSGICTPVKTLGVFAFFKDEDRMKGEVVPVFVLQPISPKARYREFGITPGTVSRGSSEGVVKEFEEIYGPGHLGFQRVQPFLNQLMTAFYEEIK